MVDYQALGRRMKMKRRSKHLSQEDVAKAARESSARAEAEKQRRFSEVLCAINLRRSQRNNMLNG